MWDAFVNFEFMRFSIYAAVLASVACGIIGSFIVVRKIVFVTGGISHTAYGGIGIAYFLGLNPLIGATVFAVLAGFLISWIRSTFAERTDTLIGILWASGMSIGILFINLTPGYAPNLMSYLFGSILGISYVDLQIIFVLDVIIFIAVFMFYRQFHIISFDEEYAKSLGIRVKLFNSIFMVLVALTVVVLIQVVGIILVIALITIPPAIAGRFVKSLKQMMVVASIIALIVTVGGIWIEYELEALTSKQIPPSATIILLASAIYLLVSILKIKRKKFKNEPTSAK